MERVAGIEPAFSAWEAVQLIASEMLIDEERRRWDPVFELAAIVRW
jgi:hypothetical protein